jgi:large subunit ribosomal protein L3
MPKTHKPRKGSLQYWPRKRAKKILPSVNWNFLQQEVEKQTYEKRFLGSICYKVGMLRILARDLTPDSLTRNREVALPVTLVECPALKIFSLRLYKESKVVKDLIVSTDKELKRKLLIPKQLDVTKALAELEKNLSNYDDLRILVYSVVKRTHIKKTPDLAEIGLAGNLNEKFELAKKFIGKEISIEEIFSPNGLVDVHGVTKGKGFSGPVKRFGISLKQHKTEKGIRRPGSLGPWTPKKVSFRAPLVGQLGYFSRVKYNNKILAIMKPEDINPKSGFNKYGMVRNPCLLIKGSLQGTQKRPLLITTAARPSKKTKKQNFEILKVMS